jgi:hypothetical protein
MLRPVRTRARVRHERDRSYTVVIEGPDGDVDVGNTRLTAEVTAIAIAGAARLYGIPEQWVRLERPRMPQPPYGREGQLVRIISERNAEIYGLLGQAHWWGAEGCWHVDVIGSRAGFLASEELDFEPITSWEERGTLEAYLEEAREEARKRRLRRAAKSQRGGPGTAAQAE